MSPVDIAERGVRAFDDFQMKHRLFAQPVGTIRKYADDRGSAFAGLVTFQVFLGMLPLLVVALTIFGRILESNTQLEDAVLESTLVQFPVIGERLESNVSALSVKGAWIWVSVAGLLWTATGIYNGFQLALNQVWNVVGVERQGFVSRNLRALLLFIMVFAAAIGTSFLRDGQKWIPGSGLVVEIILLVIGSVAAGALLLGVFRIVISPTIATSSLFPAAILAGIAWEVIQRLGSWLILDRLPQAEDLYGAIGFVIVTLFWINLLARSVVFSNEFAVVHNRRLWPRRIAQPPLTTADREVLVGLLTNEVRRPEQTVTVDFEDDGSDDDGSDDDGSDDDGSKDDPGDGSAQAATKKNEQPSYRAGPRRWVIRGRRIYDGDEDQGEVNAKSTSDTDRPVSPTEPGTAS